MSSLGWTGIKLGILFSEKFTMREDIGSSLALRKISSVGENIRLITGKS